MKSIIAMTVGLFQICTAIGAPTSTDNNGTTIDPPNLSYTAIVVNNDIDLELSESSDMQLEVEAVQPLAAQVKYVVKDDVLYIKSTGQSLKGKVKVKVKVNKLRELIINGRSNIISKGTLQSSKLNIVVNDEATLHLTSAGKLILEAGEGININIKEDKSKGNYLVL